MDYAGPQAEHDDEQSAEIVAVNFEERDAPRFTLLLRTAKLTVGAAEYLCVIRDVSSTGVSVRLFHSIPATAKIALEIRAGERQALQLVWQRGGDAGFHFPEPIDVERLIRNTSIYPKRELRFVAEIPVVLWANGQSSGAQLRNISQGGAMIECDDRLAIGQILRIQSAVMPEIQARVRWRRGQLYGLALDTVFTMMELAEIVGGLGRGAASANEASKAALRMRDGPNF